MSGVPATDRALWTRRPVFGVAGGPLEVVLTSEGRERAFAVGAQVRKGPAVHAIEALAAGDGYLSLRDGSRLSLSDLGRRFDAVTWGYLRALGMVESFQDDRGDGVRLTDAGRVALVDGLAERERLLARCRRAADAEVQL